MSGNGTMDLERLLDILDAYGAEPARWPEPERAAALALLARSEEARERLDEARELDDLLVMAPPPVPRGALAAELASDLAAQASASPVRRWAAVLWPFGPAWQPATAMAAAMLLGILLGNGLPQTGGTGDTLAEIETLLVE